MIIKNHRFTPPLNVHHVDKLIIKPKQTDSALIIQITKLLNLPLIQAAANPVEAQITLQGRAFHALKIHVLHRQYQNHRNLKQAAANHAVA